MTQNSLLGFLKKHYNKPVTVLGFFGIWQILVMIFRIKEYIVPSPISIFANLFLPELSLKYHWLKHIQTTVTEILIGFSTTALIAILIASIMNWSRLLNTIITPLIAFLNTLPKIALAPLLLVWFGYGVLPNAMIAVLVSFFPIVINTTTGLNDVEQDLLDLVRYLHASKWQVFIKIRIPNALPYIFAGLKISTTLCVVGAIVGEFVASERGLGYLIKDSQAAIDTPPMFASLILISTFGLCLFGLIQLSKSLLMRWDVTGR